MKKSIIVLSLIVLAGCKQHQKADLVVKGKIWTGQSSAPLAEAMAIAGDSIVAVGSWADIQEWKGENTKMVDAPEGQLVVPGFIDAHTHFMGGGLALASVQLKNAKTPKEFINTIKAYAKTVSPGTWITGGTWDNENWGGELPTRDWIDSVSLNNPVWIGRYDGHMALANSVALKAAEITDRVTDIAGGVVVRDAKGRVTGAFKDNAMVLVERAQPALSAEQEDKALQAAMNYVAAQGVTSIHNMYDDWNTFERAHAANQLITRIYAGTRLVNWKDLDAKIKKDGWGDKWVRYGNLKEFVDGSLGSHTAAFFKAFTDAPKDSGFFITPEDVLYKRIKSADSAGLHLMVHAIGDKGIHVLLNIFEKVARENGPKDRRFRIEHVQHLDPRDVPSFKTQDIIASMQPYHAIDDGRFAEKLIGYERCKTTYAFRSLMDAGARVAFGSDWPVAPATPLEGIYAAVTRRTLDDKNPDGWIPEQKVTVEQALRAYTVEGAYASFEEKIKGSLAPGKLADFVVLEKDITVIDPTEIRNVKVLSTYVGGKAVYSLKE